MPNEELQPDPVEMDHGILEDYDLPGKLTSLICPECGGSMWEIRRDNLLNFRCHVGHAFSLESFLVEQADEIELSLWKTLRTLKDRAKIFRQLAAENHRQNNLAVALQFERQADNALKRAEILRQVIQVGELNPEQEAIAPAETDPE